MKPEEEIVAIINDVPTSNRSRLFEALVQEYPELGTTALAGAQVGTPPTYEVGQQATDFESQLTHEQYEKLGMLTYAIVEAFHVPKDDLRLVTENTPEGNRRLILIDSSPMGQYIGSYRSIYYQKKNLIDIKGEKIDVLQNMTNTAYKAMIDDCIVRGTKMPDSPHNETWTSTMLTGEPLKEGLVVQCRYVANNGINENLRLPESANRELRVRPTVVIAEL